jgi:hypothetical protein
MSLLYCIAKWMEHVDNLVLLVTLRIIIISGFQHWRKRELCRDVKQRATNGRYQSGGYKRDFVYLG